MMAGTFPRQDLAEDPTSVTTFVTTSVTTFPRQDLAEDPTKPSLYLPCTFPVPSLYLPR